MVYKEPKDKGNPYRNEYLASIEKSIKLRQNEARIKRDLFCKDIIKNPDFFRTELEKLLGWPLSEYKRDEKCDAKMTEVMQDEEKIIYRVQIEVFDNFWFYGILFLHKDEADKPFVICQHGGGGTPELCSSMYEAGSSNYNDMSMRIFNKGANVFAPQLLLWEEQYGNSFKRTEIDAAFKQTGGSLAAVEIYSIRKSIDWLCDNKYAIESRIGFCGLSYGGFYALYTSAIDKRIKSCLSSCFFNEREKYTWSDLVWQQSAEKIHDTEVALLVYPRKLKIQIGENDACFASEYAKNEYERLCTLADKTDIKSWLDFTFFDGIHEFWKNDTQIDSLLNDLR